MKVDPNNLFFTGSLGQNFVELLDCMNNEFI